MSALSITELNKRGYPRSPIETEFMYKSTNNTSYGVGTMIDLSQSGTLINVDHEFDLDSNINLLFESKKEGVAGIKITAGVIRQAEPSGIFTYSYGCMILDVVEL